MLRIVHRALVDGMPTGDRQELRVITATLNPADRTPRHTHRFPVAVYVMQGTFTLELEGRDPITANAGAAIIEPPHIKMTGVNAKRNRGDPTRNGLCERPRHVIRGPRALNPFSSDAALQRQP